MDELPLPVSQDSGSPLSDSVLEDREWMKRAAQGDKDAFGCLVEKYQQRLLNFFLRLGVSSDVEDLVQESFLRVYRYRDRYKPTAKFTTFLYTVARSACLDRARKRGRFAALQDAYGQHLVTEQQVADRQNQAQRPDIRAALDRLPPKLREVLVLSVYEEMKYHEIAAVLDIPEGTVKSRVHTAVAELRNLLGGEST